MQGVAFPGIRVYLRLSVSPPFVGMIQCCVWLRYNPLSPIQTSADSEQALCVIQFTVLFLQLSKGFGKSIDPIGQKDLVEVQKVLTPSRSVAQDLTGTVELYK